MEAAKVVSTEQGRYVNLQILDNGNLRLELNKENVKEYKEDIISVKESQGIDYALVDMLADHCTGNWFVGNAGDYGHLSTCMIIADDCGEDKNGNVIPWGRQWINPRYALDDEATEILEKGYYDFEPLEKYAS